MTFIEGHRFTKSPAEAAAVALKKGMDNECADFFIETKDNSDYVKYLDAVKQGLLSEKDLDIAVKRLFTARMRLGMFDPPDKVPYAQTPDSEIDSAAHRELALKVARESMVLLKNDGVLPFAPGVKNILVVGPLAQSVAVLHGNYSGTASHATTALEGIRKQFATAQVSYVPGTNFLRPETVIPTSALSTSDGKPGLQGEYFSGDFAGHAADRARGPICGSSARPAGCARAYSSRRFERVFRTLDRVSDAGRIGQISHRPAGLDAPHVAGRQINRGRPETPRSHIRHHDR